MGVGKTQPRNIKNQNSNEMYRTQDVPNIGRVGSGGRADHKKTENDVEGAIVLNAPQI